MLLGLALSWPVEAARSYGPVKDQDTLWNIATQLRPDKNATVQQTMLALYYKNPQAFANNNINSLMKGTTLRAPTSAEVRRYRRIDALREARKQNTYWKRGINLPKTTPPPVPQYKERTANKRTKPAVVKASTNYAATPKSTNRRISRLQAQLQAAEVKNQQLTTELNALQNKQSKGKSTPALDAQVKKLKIELQELTTVLDQKDNHIKTLQASLKNASETIKSQHDDNMRLYDKLKEVSPSSVPATPNASGKSELKLSTVEASTAAVAASAAAAKASAEANNEAKAASDKTSTASTTEAKPADDKVTTASTTEAKATDAANASKSATEPAESIKIVDNKEAPAKSVWADEQKAKAAQAAEQIAEDTDTKTASANTAAPAKTEAQTLAAALPSTTPDAKAANEAEKPASETTPVEAAKTNPTEPTAESSSKDKAASEAATTESKTSDIAKATENKAVEPAKANESTDSKTTAEPAKTGNSTDSKTAEANTSADKGTGGTASKSPATSETANTNSDIKAPSNAQGVKSEPTNDVKASSSVPVSQMVSESAGATGSKSATTGSSAPFRGVSPLALAVAAISLLFILALVWRAFVQRRDMKRLEAQEAQMAERMRKRLDDNQSAAATTATLVDKKEPEITDKKDTDSEPEIKF
jgi:FimV-like protein